MDTGLDDDTRIREIQREYVEFLDDDGDQGIYIQKVNDMITENSTRLVVNINDLRRKIPERAKSLLTSSFEELVAFQRALKETVGSVDAVYSKNNDEFFIGFEGSFGARHLTPRSLKSSFLGNMVCVEGIVTKCSLVLPKVVKSVHYCPATTKTLKRQYADMTSLDAFPSSAAYPTKDDDGNLIETEYGLSTYKDHQSFSIQEMPEKAPAGQLPRSVDIIADNDLVDKCKPGDRVQVVGMFRCLPGKNKGYTSGSFRTILIGNNIKCLSKEVTHSFTANDIAKIKKFSKQRDVFNILGKSLAPSIHGHEYVKKAILCMLLGGTEKILENGTRLRGDINILLIGDPSVAKSQMLRYVLNTAPRAITTTGRGSSGVGLTAAVTTDQESGERRLEAGAMVLADRGVVCIDEFDKMSDIDRTAIHEVMEQGRVTISKAGIHTKLNARCSVLAAANPVYGRYDQYKTPMENIGLQDSLLSRFDLLFVMLDKMEVDSDRKIADHVLRMHRYRNPGEQDGDVLMMCSNVDLLTTKDSNTEQDEEVDTPVYDKYDQTLHGHSRSKKDLIVSKAFMRKYIHVAREIKPKLTTEACHCLAEEYAKLRNRDDSGDSNMARTTPVTPRALETMIRLATAHAKARLHKTIGLDDAHAALDLINMAYFRKVLQKEKKRKTAEDSGDDDDVEESEEEAMDEGESQKGRRTATKRRQRQQKDGGEDPYEFDADAPSDDEGQVSTKKARGARETRPSQSGGDTATISDERLKTFKSSLLEAFKDAHAQSLERDAIVKHINTKENFQDDEVDAALDKMMDDNQLMVSDNVVFLI